MSTTGPRTHDCVVCAAQRQPHGPKPAAAPRPPILIGRKVNGRKVGLRPFVGVGPS